MLPIAIAGNNGTASASLWPILATSDQFKQLSRIFDQVSLKGARVTITPYTAVSFTGGSSTLVMNWDRNGNLDETGVWRTPTYNEIVSYSSTRMYNVGDLSVPRNYYMSIYPSSMNEKIEYMSTDFVRNYQDAQQTAYCKEFQFYPTLDLGVQIPNNAQIGAGMNFSLQVTYSLRFRGVRFQANAQDITHIAGNGVVFQRREGGGYAPVVNLQPGANGDVDNHLRVQVNNFGAQVIVPYQDAASADAARNNLNARDPHNDAGYVREATAVETVDVRVHSDHVA